MFYASAKVNFLRDAGHQYEAAEQDNRQTGLPILRKCVLIIHCPLNKHPSSDRRRILAFTFAAFVWQSKNAQSGYVR